MKRAFISRITLYIALGAVLLVVSCKKDKGSASNPGGSAGNGSFSVVLNGKTIGGTDKLNNGIVIIAADSGSSGGLLSDVFVSFRVAGDTIGFHIPDQTGETVVGGPTTPSQYYGVFTGSGEVYLFNPVSVNVTTDSKDRIKGTFSGHLSTSLVEGEGEQADITGGTFDLPLIRP